MPSDSRALPTVPPPVAEEDPPFETIVDLPRRSKIPDSRVPWRRIRITWTAIRELNEIAIAPNNE